MTHPSPNWTEIISYHQQDDRKLYQFPILTLFSKDSERGKSACARSDLGRETLSESQQSVISHHEIIFTQLKRKEKPVELNRPGIERLHHKTEINFLRSGDEMLVKAFPKEGYERNFLKT